MKRTVIVSAMFLAVAACGGGGSAEPPVSSSQVPPATAEGFYKGTLSGGGNNADFAALILENGEIWGLYGQDNGSIAYVNGFVQGSGVSSNGSYTSDNAKDFGSYPAVSGTLTSTYNSSAKTLSGTVSNQAGSMQFSGGPMPGSLYNYDTPASLSSITGMWSAMSNDGGSVSVNITASGTLTTLEPSGCSGTGTIAPRPSGKNVFDVSLTFGPAPCVFAGQTGTGIATATPLSTGQMQFTASMVSASRTAGVVVFGIR